RLIFFFQAEDGIRDRNVTGVQTCALPISNGIPRRSAYLICLPNFAAVGEVSAGISRSRNWAATRFDSARSSSFVTATTTAVGTDRDALTASVANSLDNKRERPMDIPTPG